MAQTVGTKSPAHSEETMAKKIEPKNPAPKANAEKTADHAEEQKSQRAQRVQRVQRVNRVN
jgi:hypothetical protein